VLGKIFIYTDGGSRGNPGPAAAAFVLRDEAQNELAAQGFFLGEATNNYAEYSAIVKALEAAGKFAAGNVVIYCDSELAVRQINGHYKVKNENIRPLFEQVMELLCKFESWQVQFIPREKNQKADALVNRALNLQRDVTESPDTKASTRKNPLRLALLISGGGRTMMNILDQIKAGRLNARIALVISSRSTVGGVEKANNAGLNVKIIRTKDFPETGSFSRRIEEELIKEKIELVVQGGWLCYWKIPHDFTNRVMNIHPALLPSFGGKGMWGHHVHQAVLDAGCKVSGCTVHFCTNEYDAGPIIVQRCCPVMPDDTADTLAERVFAEECIAYPQAIRLFAEEKIDVENNIVKILA
jgi:phosphoribosylglycinamide formyltransferase-1